MKFQIRWQLKHFYLAAESYGPSATHRFTQHFLNYKDIAENLLLNYRRQEVTCRTLLTAVMRLMQMLPTAYWSKRHSWHFDLSRQNCLRQQLVWQQLPGSWHFTRQVIWSNNNQILAPTGLATSGTGILLPFYRTMKKEQQLPPCLPHTNPRRTG